LLIQVERLEVNEEEEKEIRVDHERGVAHRLLYHSALGSRVIKKKRIRF